MKSKIGTYLLVLSIGLVIGFFIGRGSVDTTTVDAPVTIDVPVPPVVSDTVVRDSLIPVEVKVPNPVNSKLLKDYDRLKDTLAKRDAYIAAITKREYNETFEDSIQTIDVAAFVTGTLDTLSVSYKTKPRTIRVDTVVKIKVPQKSRSLQAYVESRAIQLGSNRSGELLPVFDEFKGGIDIVNKKNTIIGVSASHNFTNGQSYGWLKIGKSWDW